MNTVKPTIGVISNLGMLDEESYLRENQLDEFGTAIALGRQSTAEDILAVMEASDLLIFTGSTDNVLTADERINWDSHLVRRSLITFVHILQTGRRDLLEKAALFFCFSAQLLSVALALHQWLLDLGQTVSDLEELETVLAGIIHSEAWQNPLCILKCYQKGVQETNCGRSVLVSHGQAISPSIHAYLEAPSFRVAGKTRILESGTLIGTGWELHQSHADYNATLVRQLHPEITKIPVETRAPLYTHLNPFKNDSHPPRKRRMVATAA